MSSIFISYSHNDEKFAKKLAKDLSKEGHSAWIDQEQIIVGDSLLQKIDKAIHSVDYVIVIISTNSINSIWVKKEIHLASARELRENRVVVLPILLDNVKIPSFLSDKFYLNFLKKDFYEENFKKLIKRLEPKTNENNSTIPNLSFLKPYTFIVTPGHCWLRVPLSELKELGIANQISSYSYQDNLYAYLEEDDDLSEFIKSKSIKIKNDNYDIEKDYVMVFLDKFPIPNNNITNYKKSNRNIKKQLKSTLIYKKIWKLLISIISISVVLTTLLLNLKNINEWLASDLKQTISINDKDNFAIKNIPTQKVLVGDTIVYKIETDGVPENAVNFKAENLPIGAILNHNVFTWKPRNNQEGIYFIKNIAEYKGNEKVGYNAIVVRTAEHTNEINDSNMTRLKTVFLNVKEGNKILLNIADSKASVTFKNKNLAKDSIIFDNCFIWVPDFNQSGNYELNFSINDEFKKNIHISVVDNPNPTYPEKRLVYYWKSTVSLIGDSKD